MRDLQRSLRWFKHQVNGQAGQPPVRPRTLGINVTFVEEFACLVGDAMKGQTSKSLASRNWLFEGGLEDSTFDGTREVLTDKRDREHPS